MPREEDYECAEFLIWKKNSQDNNVIEVFGR
jgi:hypothetical protein